MSVFLATAGYDHTIRLWEPHKGSCVRSIPFQESVIAYIKNFSKLISLQLHLINNFWLQLRIQLLSYTN